MMMRYRVANLSTKKLSNQDKAPYCFLILSGLAYSTACTFYFMSSQLTGTGLAMVIYFTYPLFVVLFVVLAKRKWADKKTFISLVILLLGLFLLKNPRENQVISGVGLLYGLASAFFFAVYVYLSKLISNKLPSYLLTFLLCLSNSLFFAIYSLSTHTFIIPSSLKMWAFACGLGIIATALPVQLMLEGIKNNFG